MTNMQRVKKVLAAILMILCSGIVIIYPEDGFYLVASIVCVSLLLYGIRTMVYYLTMARHMVGGKSILYFGIIVLDLGIFIFTTVDDPKLFVVIYLFVFSYCVCLRFSSFRVQQPGKGEKKPADQQKGICIPI